MSIYFARHGETDWNIAQRVQGTTDIPLNENGIRQAEILSENLERENVKLCRIYTSFQRRALRTAEIVGTRYHLPVKVLSGLEEMNLGLFEGHTWEKIQASYPDEFQKWQSEKRYYKAPGGESYQDLLERLFLALDRILEEGAGDVRSGKDVLVVTHGAVMMALVTLQKDLDFATSYTVINIENAKAMKFGLCDLQEIRKKL